MESQPLLHDQRQTGLPPPTGYSTAQDHPIFLRAAHSPWQGLNQNVLTYLRGAIVVYLTAVGGMLVDYKVERIDNEPHNLWYQLWQFSTITFALLWLYHVIVFSWTFTHLNYPDISPDDRRVESVILRAMSPPQQTSDSRNRFYFSLFYTVTHVFVFMNVILYWTITVPHGYGHLPKPDKSTGKPIDDFFRHGWFEPFCILNLYGYTALLAVGEILFLNSIKRPVPVPSHIFGLTFFAAAYLGWASFGKLLTGHNAFFWMDDNNVGSREAVAAYCAGFVSLAPAVFSWFYGLTGIRESMTSQNNNNRGHQGGYYIPAPQNQG